MKLSLVFAGVVFLYSLSCVNAIQGGASAEIDVPAGVIDCGSTEVKITLNASYLESLGVTLADVDGVVLSTDAADPVTTSSTCGSPLNSTNNYTLTLDFDNVDECAFLAESEGENIIYCFRVVLIYRSSMGVPIVRYIRLVWTLYCTYPNKRSISFGPLTPIHRKNHLVADDEIGNFVITMSRQDETFTNEVTVNDTVNLPDPIFIQASLSTAANEENLILQATSCFVTQTSNPDDSTKMYLIQDNCAAPDLAADGMTEVLDNFDGTVVRFRFNSFYWIAFGPARSRLYIHCCFRVCSKNLSPTCEDDMCGVQARSGKRKRDVSDDTLTMEKENQLTATFGPIEIKEAAKHVGLVKKEKDESIAGEEIEIVKEPEITRFSESHQICDKMREGCSYDCGLMDAERIVCVCPPGFGLRNDGKTCFKHFAEIEKEVESYNSNYILPASALLVALISYILIVTTKLSDE